ncbi:NAD(P)-dependent dehydrogenase (short-subunit alcohol dehydrogenase family) [Actinomycetospora succinea]|uniref:NAD(P)-dependent dehydrogenase (Short-subunit alcohol dehydrogenase family) n=1 Tax=Actinomycetospora succinea TaxID=663603 RepID=A0A4R6VGK4_9PSEU|nr:SDR family oxidoreductase [Actinomycetospora succinea]TDQ62418.1 NAD(P)-dependent dehydrogenase (short-subunit alcohol dehydrogenase family) [Actinomycetospora succinea]
MDLGLADARVIVTGGASNIGRGIVHGFAREGARILLADRDGEQAARVCEEGLALGAAALEVLEIDLTTDGAGGRVVAAALDRFDGVDALVNNAGWSVPGFLTEQTDRALWQRTIETNLYTAIDCTQAALAPMAAAGAGSIVFISSDAAFGAIRQGVYGTTKAGLIALARTTAREQGRHGVRSNVVCPGLVLPEEGGVGATSLWAGGQDAVFDEAQVASVVKQQPLRRLTTAADIADAVVWLSSPRAARQVTGQVLAVGGGSSMP